MKNRFDRNTQLFGTEGQAALRRASVAIVGVGGLGAHVAQQLAYLGVGTLTLIDHDVVTLSSLNRLVGAYPDDIDVPKVQFASRNVHRIDPTIECVPLQETIASNEAVSRVRVADVAISCVDNDGARLLINELCSSSAIPHLDLASDILPESGAFGGRVFVNWSGSACLVCMGLLDLLEVQEALESGAQEIDRNDIYGVDKRVLAGGGPSVVSVNGVIASLAVTEFMAGLTGLREPRRLLTYRGHLGTVSTNKDAPEPDCYYCNAVRGSGELSRALECPIH